MFDSGITVKSVVEKLISEDNISPKIQEDFYYFNYSSFITLLYSEYIKEQVMYTMENVQSPVSLNHSVSGCEKMRFCDILKVFAKDSEGREIELEKSDLISSYSFMNNCYFSVDNKFGFKCSFEVSELRIIYVSIPLNFYKLFKEDKSIYNVNIPLPIEFVPLIYSYLRSEKYRLTEADDLCEKWTQDCNSKLLDFKKWIEQKNCFLNVGSEA